MDHPFHPRSEWAIRHPSFSPLPPTSLIYFHHTAGLYMPTFSIPAMRALEESEISRGSYIALAYHTIIPGDGSIVESRPSNVMGGATINHNSDSRAICFPGNYMYTILTDAQIDAAAEQIARWVRDGHVKKDWSAYPHSAVFATACPGDNVRSQLPTIATLAQRKIAGGGSSTPSIPDLTPIFAQGDPMHTVITVKDRGLVIDNGLDLISMNSAAEADNWKKKAVVYGEYTMKGEDFDVLAVNRRARGGYVGS